MMKHTAQYVNAVVEEHRKRIAELEAEVQALKRTIRDLRNRGRCDKLPHEHSYSESGE